MTLQVQTEFWVTQPVGHVPLGALHSCPDPLISMPHFLTLTLG